ncbi:Reverse transcriptase domain-containing protein [Aphis craccivora]|uniref:Reverse transcriptase domain-containing protein n=1 Tax=Aphis craccivora TaxID=307492 RepID=A0A6G0Y448_APHCR|nr:Reverse transcriptase domain-containing protein [Aphis craccivora]
MDRLIDEMKDHTRGISINGKQFHSIRFADDIALLADSEEKMSLMFHILESSLDKFKLKINSKNQNLQQVNEFCYLGSLITDDNKSTKEKRRRIKLAKHAFEKKKFGKTYIWSILLYNCESWTIGKYEKDRLEAMEMWM